MSEKYDEINGGFKARNTVSDALLRKTRVELERCDGVHPAEFQRQPGESNRAHQNRLRDEVENLKHAEMSDGMTAEQKLIERLQALRISHKRERTGVKPSAPGTYVQFNYRCKAECPACGLARIIKAYEREANK